MGRPVKICQNVSFRTVTWRVDVQQCSAGPLAHDYVSYPPLPQYEDLEQSRWGQIRSRSWVFMITFNASHFFFGQTKMYGSRSNGPSVWYFCITVILWNEKPTDVTISILFIYRRISTCFGPTGPSSGEFTQLFTQPLVQYLYRSGRVHATWTVQILNQ